MVLNSKIFFDMNFKFGLILFVSLITLSFGLHKNLNKKIDKEIRTTFNVETYTYNVITISQEVVKELTAKFDNNNLLKIHTKDELLGYAYIGKAPSKTDEFDYLVLFDKDLIIMKSKILIYREDYGGEIGSKRWLKQFIGKTPTDELIYGDNIAAISGATISVKSMTLAINKLLQSIKILHNKNII